MRILRHEAGHAIDNAYKLRQRRRRQQVFGPSYKAYPQFYDPKPYSKSFVLHLDSWYAQSHPDEDFAETFAVWMNPESDWRPRYEGWPALKKLEYLDSLMKELAHKKPLVRAHRRVDEGVRRCRARPAARCRQPPRSRRRPAVCRAAASRIDPQHAAGVGHQPRQGRTALLRPAPRDLARRRHPVADAMSA